MAESTGCSHVIDIATFLSELPFLTEKHRRFPFHLVRQAVEFRSVKLIEEAAEEPLFGTWL